MDPSTLTAPVVAEILKSGLLGALLILACIVIWKQQAQIKSAYKLVKDVQDQRAADAQSVVDKLLMLNDKWNETLGAQLRFVQSIEASVSALQAGLSESLKAIQELRLAVVGITKQ